MYGYFEASMKLPKGQGMWPAFWPMSKASNNSWVWPPEIDIMENLGNNINKIYMTNHYSSNYPGTGGSGNQTHGIYSGPDYSADFHTYAVLWDSSQIIWYIDGVQRYKITSYMPISGHGFPGMYILLDLAAGGSWGGEPDSTTSWPSNCLVDWVRVWQLGVADTTPPSAPAGLSVN